MWLLYDAPNGISNIRLSKMVEEKSVDISGTSTTVRRHIRYETTGGRQSCSRLTADAASERCAEDENKVVRTARVAAKRKCSVLWLTLAFTPSIIRRGNPAVFTLPPSRAPPAHRSIELGIKHGICVSRGFTSCAWTSDGRCRLCGGTGALQPDESMFGNSDDEIFHAASLPYPSPPYTRAPRTLARVHRAWSNETMTR